MTVSKECGRLYVIGAGPGDPDLITVKAQRILQQVPVVFVPHKDRYSPSLAASIIGTERPPGQSLVELALPMTRDEKRLAEGWLRAADAMWRHLSAGQDGAYVSLGDPLLYGTAIYLIETLQRLHPDVSIEVVPGVTSASAASAAALAPLAAGDQRLAVITSTCGDEAIRQALDSFDTVVLLKASARFDRLLDIIEESGRGDGCVYVSRCTMTGEEVVRNISALRGIDPDYLSLIIVRR
ncbi:MAG: precorrin-2 C(20)-methyltransferase [Chloroflexi bacterium]|nr:precorrin-2 C(20)-methyltransferase [Chloroflexota bacterium]